MKTKRSILNFVTDVIPLIIVSLLGIFKLKLFIQVLGNETLGLYQLFTNIMVYIALVDGGITSAVLFHLYKPNAKKDNKKLNDILAASKKAFDLIGGAVFAIAFVVSFFIKFFIKDCSYNMSYLMLVFMLFSLSNVFQYFFVPYHVLLEVKEKKYLTNLCLQIGQIVLSILEIVMLLKGFSFISILIMHAVVKLLSNVAVFFICKKEHPEITYKSKHPDYHFTKQVKDLMVHKINGLIGSNIDIIIISKMMGLSSVAIYSIYNYIINMLKNILGKISSSIVAIVGNKKEEDPERIGIIFNELNNLVFLIAITICVPLSLAINGFIDLWYENTITTSNLVAVSFCLSLYIFIIRLATTTFITSNGLFKETKKCAYTDMITNLILSLVLVNYLGIAGVLIATVISMFISEYIMKSVILFKYAFKQKVSKFFINNIKFFVITLLDFALGYYIMSMIPINSIIIWFLVYGLYTVVNFFIIVLSFKLIGSLESLERLKALLKRGA